MDIGNPPFNEPGGAALCPSSNTTMSSASNQRDGPRDVDRITHRYERATRGVGVNPDPRRHQQPENLQTARSEGHDSQVVRSTRCISMCFARGRNDCVLATANWLQVSHSTSRGCQKGRAAWVSKGRRGRRQSRKVNMKEIAGKRIKCRGPTIVGKQVLSFGPRAFYVVLKPKTLKIFKGPSIFKGQSRRLGETWFGLRRTHAAPH